MVENPQKLNYAQFLVISEKFENLNSRPFFNQNRTRRGRKPLKSKFHPIPSEFRKNRKFEFPVKRLYVIRNQHQNQIPDKE